MWRNTFLQRPWRLPGLSVLLAGLVCAPLAASADDEDAPLPAPRVTVQIGAADVVLEATGNQLYAFVDRTADNTPIPGATLRVVGSDNYSIGHEHAPVPLREVSSGVFTGSLNRIGQTQGVFSIALQSSVASGEATATIIYNDALKIIPPAGLTGSGKLMVAGASMAVSAAAVLLCMVLWRHPGQP